MLTTTEKEAVKNIAHSRLGFRHYPAFARFIRENHMTAYVKDLLEASREASLPIMKYLQHIPEEQLLEMGIQGHGEFLSCVENNTLEEYIQKSLKTWENDEMGILAQDEIGTDDITRGGYVRKKVQLKYLQLYTTDIAEALSIIREIDTYEAESSSAATHTYIRILRKKIHEHAHFIEKVANTTPSIIYVYDRVNQRELYTNSKLTELLGFTQEDLQAQGVDVIQFLVHPDDVERLMENEKNFHDAADGEIRSVEYRIRDKTGKYRWMRAFEAVFKRDAEGFITEKIGVAIDVDKQKYAEEQLQQRELQLLEAQELVNMGSFMLDIDTNKLDVTPQYLKIFEIEGPADRKELQKGVHPADKAKLAEVREKAIRENGIYECEYRHIVNGREKVIWARGSASMQDGRQIMKGTVIDVTNRHYMIQRLQRSEILYKQAQSLAHIGNWAWDLIQGKLQWSDELYNIYGIEPGTPVTYETALKFLHPADVEIATATISSSMETLAPYDFQYRIINAKGKTLMLHAKGEVLAEDGKAFKLLGTLQDITNEYLTEQQLISSREFIEKIANTSPSLLAAYNINTGKYSFINNAVEKILGYQPQQILNEGIAFFMNIIHPDDAAPIMEKNAQALQEANENIPTDGKEPIVEFKYRLRHKNGHYHWFHTYGTIFDRDEEGKVEQVLNVSVDITEQEEAEQELYRKNIQLQQSNASLEEYAYVASHDLKEPLRKIATFGDRLMMTNSNNLTGDGKVYLEKIISSSRRMQAMISDLLAVSMISGDKTFEPCSLKTIVADVLQTLEYKIEEQKAVVTTDDLPVVEIVPSQFRQLFQNLISNSLKFTKDGKTPEISITHQYLNPVSVRQYNLAIAPKYLNIQFSDNGIGFDNQFANKIFTIFQRLHGKNEYEGTGIGLAICKKVAENHGGTIIANGTPGQGAIFNIIIPV